MGHFLFVMPGFVRGAGSTIDLMGYLEESAYNLSATPAEADWKASLADWRAVRAELRAAIESMNGDNPRPEVALPSLK
jgi:hypothetical protein